jgi:hypothetical protein
LHESRESKRKKISNIYQENLAMVADSNITRASRGKQKRSGDLLNLYNSLAISLKYQRTFLGRIPGREYDA